jgi:hypothetical protein
MSADGNEAGVVCSFTTETKGIFPQLPLLINAREMRGMLVKAFNENKLSNELMNEISVLLQKINPNA